MPRQEFASEAAADAAWDALASEAAPAPAPLAPWEAATPDGALPELGGNWTEVARYDVGADEGAVPLADVAGFEKGEDVLDVVIFAGPESEEIDIEIAPSEDGKDSLLSANGQVLAILRGVPNADVEDFRITVEDPL